MTTGIDTTTEYIARSRTEYRRRQREARKAKKSAYEATKLQKTRFIVMTAAAHMPSSCKGTYKRIAVVETDLPEGQPAFIGAHAMGVVRIVETWERCHVGKTERCEYAKALRAATEVAERMNAQLDLAIVR